MSVHTWFFSGMAHARAMHAAPRPCTRHARAFSGVHGRYARPHAHVFTLPLSAFWPASVGGAR